MGISNLDLQQIVELDTVGNLVATYGNYAAGSDSSYFLMIIGWGVDQNGIYVADAEKRTLSLLSFDNTIASSFKIRFPIVRADYLGNDEFIVKSFDSIQIDQDKFINVSLSEQRVNLINNLLPSIENGDFVLDGFFIKNSAGRHFHVCYMKGLYQATDNTGQLLYNTATVDQSPDPFVIRAG